MSKDLAKKYFYLSIFSIILTVSLCVAGYYYIFTKNMEFPALEAEVAEEKSSAESFRSAENTAKAIEEAREKIDALFLGKTIGQKAEFVTAIDELAASIPVELETSLSSQTVPKENRYQYFVLQGTARGSLDSIYKFLLLLENYPKALEVPKVEIEKIPTDPKKGDLWRLSFVARVVELK